MSAQIWGLTGGIASGKSTTARYFAEAGIPVIDADQLVRELSLPTGPAYQPILERFGTVDRQALRKLIFKDPIARRDLEAILHPLIRTESLNRVKLLASTGGPVIYEAALLVETGRHRDLHGLIVVDCPITIRKSRLMTRDGISEELATQMIDAQIADDLRLKEATHVLHNDGDNESLRRQVQTLVKTLTDTQ